MVLVFVSVEGFCETLSWILFFDYGRVAWEGMGFRLVLNSIMFFV